VAGTGRPAPPLARAPNDLREQHDLEEPSDVLVRDVRVEEVAHAVHEDRSGLSPAEGLVDPFRPQAHGERVASRDVTIDHREPSEIALLMNL
jgi:hypothetical protein